MNRPLIAALAMLALTACGTDTPAVTSSTLVADGHGPTCDMWLTEPVSVSAAESGCWTDGDHLNATLVLACPANRQWFYNDAVHGYVDEPAIAGNGVDLIPAGCS